MSRLTVNASSLENEGLDTETVDLGTSNLQVGIGGGGADGVGVASIEQTVTSTEDGGINEVTQTLTDGTTAVFQIRNGSRGSQGVQGERGEKGDAGEDWIPTQQELASIAQSAAALVDVPTKTSDLQNDSHFATEAYVIRETADMAVAIDDMRGEANGFASLDANGKVPSSQLPSSGGGGDTNVIEVVKVNGTALTPDSNKAVDVPVPTEQTVSGWGFTKNTGTYSKPSGGIPKTDLESAVQTSLGKADTALQSFTESDPTVPSWAKQSTKPTYTASEVGALPASTTIPSALADLSADSTHRTVTDAEKTAWNGKQNALTWDTTPTQNSTNPVTSGGLYNVLGNIETLINAL